MLGLKLCLQSAQVDEAQGSYSVPGRCLPPNCQLVLASHLPVYTGLYDRRLTAPFTIVIRADVRTCQIFNRIRYSAWSTWLLAHIFPNLQKYHDPSLITIIK